MIQPWDIHLFQIYNVVILSDCFHKAYSKSNVILSNFEYGFGQEVPYWKVVR